MRKITNRIKSLLNLRGKERLGGALGIPEPVVTHHPPLVRVRDRPLLQLLHIRERLLQSGLHLPDKLIGEPDPAHVQEQPQLLVLVQPVYVPPPQLDGVLLESRPRRGEGRGAEARRGLTGDGPGWGWAAREGDREGAAVEGQGGAAAAAAGLDSGDGGHAKDGSHGRNYERERGRSSACDGGGGGGGEVEVGEGERGGYIRGMGLRFARGREGGR